ncbi:MAG: aspartate aminotransferase [Alphaproteobacteria bacterium TMED62]|nr:MAG: aspartate aminotransferase [Alphaproteobacteria bacterium TMED62]|tara:strand:- start:969 stop:2177 length:1209 start_codon:yes stop_codon:yes gene_type:complete
MKNNFISERVQNIKPSPTMEVTSKARELKEAGHDIIGLGAGEPDFDTPTHIKEAAIEAINQGKTKYTAVDGILELKEAIIDKFSRENNLLYNTNQVSVATGGKQILFNAFQATLNKGDEVIIPAPYWVSYPDMVILAEGTPVFIETKKENNFKITSDMLNKVINERTKWIVLNSPSNPTGACYSKKELIEIGKLLKKYENILILTDDIYEKIIYENFVFSTIAEAVPSLKSRTLTVNGVSKAFSMTGWRIGYAGGPESLIKSMAKIQSQSTSNPTTISQYAALKALTSPSSFLKENNTIFLKRRNLILDLVNSSKGLECNVPSGAFYIFPSCEGLIGCKTSKGNIINNSSDFSKYLLEEAGVAVVPGIAFGLENFFRISYATSNKILEEAGNRIFNACKLLT